MNCSGTEETIKLDSDAFLSRRAELYRVWEACFVDSHSIPSNESYVKSYQLLRRWKWVWIFKFFSVSSLRDLTSIKRKFVKWHQITKLSRRHLHLQVFLDFLEHFKRSSWIKVRLTICDFAAWRVAMKLKWRILGGKNAFTIHIKATKLFSFCFFCATKCIERENYVNTEIFSTILCY